MGNAICNPTVGSADHGKEFLYPQMSTSSLFVQPNLLPGQEAGINCLGFLLSLMFPVYLFRCFWVLKYILILND